MAVITYKYIPMNPSTIIETPEKEIADYFAGHIGHFDDIQKKTYKEIQFIDCGSRFESVVCNHCYHSLLHIWGPAMDRSDVNTKFTDRKLTAPCCGKETDLNDLVYYGDCGFAKSVIEVRRPSDDIDDLEINQLEKLFGCSFKCVIAL